MEKNEIEATLDKSRKSMSNAAHTQIKDSSSISDVSQSFIAIVLYRLCIQNHVSINFILFLFGDGAIGFLATDARSFRKFSRKGRNGKILTKAK